MRPTSKAPPRPGKPRPRRKTTCRPASGTPDRETEAEAARYIAEFTAELSLRARQARLDLLAYLLDMARLEAKRALRPLPKRS